MIPPIARIFNLPEPSSCSRKGYILEEIQQVCRRSIWVKTMVNFSKNQIIALIAIAGVALVGLSLGSFRGSKNASLNNSRITINKASATNRDTGSAEAIDENSGEVVVHVAGEVNSPGVYRLAQGSRVMDAIELAGGATADANLDVLNLAERVRDAQQVYVQSKSAQVTTPVSGPASSYTSSSSSSSTKSPIGMININTAGIAELDRLPGVGPVTAQKIIDYRKQIGRFTSVDQLIEVSGIGPKKMEQMRPYVTL